MMKKMKYIVASALCLVALSCSKEVSPLADDSLQDVAFEVSLHSLSETKAVSDGTSADILYYEIYAGDKKVESRTIDRMQEGLFRFNTRLVKCQKYDVLFWAQDRSCTAYDTGNLRKVTVNYSDAVANDESRDAFFGYVRDMEVDPDAHVNVRNIELRRPFALICVGTSEKDWNAYSPSSLVSSVSLTGSFPTVFDVLEGSASEPVSQVDFTSAPAPSETFTAESEEFHLIAMAYVLAPDGEDNTASLTVNAGFDGKYMELRVDDVPYASNFRTNLTGDLFNHRVQ